MNFRFSFLMAVVIIVLTVVSCCLFVTQKLKLSLLLILVGVLIVCVIFIFVFRKKLFAVLIAILLISLLPVASIYFKSEKLIKNQKLIAADYGNNFRGKIDSVSLDLKENIIFIGLDKVKILGNEKEENFYGKIYLYINSNGVDTSKLRIGNFLEINNARLDGLTLCQGSNSRDRSFISKGYSATSYVFAYNLKFIDSNAVSFRDKIKQSVYNSFEGTDRVFTDIGYAMMFGESDVLEDEVYGVFREAGIAHLLAVSGFHVSVIVAFLSAVLNKIKFNKFAKMFIISSLLLFYAYLCSFSISVIRASLMSILLLHANNRNKEYDKLSSLSLVASLILIVDPMQLFNISFILSFVSILSIILLMPLFERLLSKVFFEKVSSAISVSLAVCLGITAFQIYYFGTASLLGIISNIITIPIVGFLFIFLLISVVIGSIFGFVRPLVQAFGYGMKYVVQFNNWIAQNGICLRFDGVGVISLVISIALMFIVSDYLFLRKRYKIPIVCLLSLLLVIAVI